MTFNRMVRKYNSVEINKMKEFKNTERSTLLRYILQYLILTERKITNLLTSKLLPLHQSCSSPRCQPYRLEVLLSVAMIPLLHSPFPRKGGNWIS